MYISFGIVHCMDLVHKLTTRLRVYGAFLLGGHKKQQTVITLARDFFRRQMFYICA